MATESSVLHAALDSFRQYRRVSHLRTTHRRRTNFYALPRATWQTLARPPIDYLSTLDKVDEAITANALIAEAIVKTTLESFISGEQDEMPTTQNNEGKSVWWHGTATQNDMDKARSTVRQFYRDWSAEGRGEREASYGPVRRGLHSEYSSEEGSGGRRNVRVLVPGAGLARLVFDLCTDGFTVEGNEISYHQLMGSNWILNHIPTKDDGDEGGGYERMTLYPFATDFSNVVRRADQLHSVAIPDVHPGWTLNAVSAEERGEMSMTASDFLLLYGDAAHAGVFDAVATVFFVDTAPNVVRYVETIWHCLKEEGVWFNHGPLLWHFEDRTVLTHDHDDGSSQNHIDDLGKVHDGGDAATRTQPTDDEERQGIEAPGSVELTADELLQLVKSMGFDLEETNLPGDGNTDEQVMGHGYIQNPRSMLQNAYRCVYWKARKRARSEH